ncbi:RodZ domain-containing protein [Alteromonas gracilis]|uniref:RodZ domain-containing protein n=1 Tax=Alteromonas gracilis TaxID=1479524 RepID=UPI003736A9E3
MVSEEKANQEVTSQQQENTPSPGAMLKARRETLGLSQQDIADKLFLKAHQINELENDIIDEKSSVTFTKGYVRNYAKQLGMNSEEVIEAFERYHNQTSVPSSEKLQSFSKRVAKQTHDDRWMMVTYIILLLIIAGVVVWWYQQPSDDAVSDVSELPLTEAVKREASETSISSGNSTNGSAQLDGRMTMGSSPSQPSLNDGNAKDANPNTPLGEESGGQFNAEDNGFTQDGNLDDGAISAPDTAINDSNNLTALVSYANDENESQPSLNITPQSNAAPISMVFSFEDDCWVNIKDASGEAIAYGVKQKGRVMEIQGVPPVEVTLGAPDNVRITVNGESVDISSYQNGKTARFVLPL